MPTKTLTSLTQLAHVFAGLAATVNPKITLGVRAMTYSLRGRVIRNFGSKKLATLADATVAARIKKGLDGSRPLQAHDPDDKDKFGKFLDETIQSAVRGNTGIVASQDPRMAAMEFGRLKIPPRPVFGIAIKEFEKTGRAIIGTTVEAMIGGRIIPKPMP